MLVIFDWDGTLVDSAPKIVRCLAQASADAGLPTLTKERYRHIIGLGLPEAIANLYPEAEPQQREALRLRYSDLFIADKEPTRFFDGVLEGLRALRSEGFALAVATGKSRRGMQRVLLELQLLTMFDCTRCADETASKPHPKMLYEILLELGRDADQAVMVGDTSFDLEMASNANMASIGVRYGAHTPQHLMPHKPLALVDSFEQVLYVLRQRFSEAQA